jgi:hypothetical protein
MSGNRDSDGYEIIFNGKSRGIYLKETAGKKLKKLQGRKKWGSALFPGCVIYSNGDDRIEFTNVGCYACAKRARRKQQ